MLGKYIEKRPGYFNFVRKSCIISYIVTEARQMKARFDIEKLRELMKDFYEISHIRIAMFDADFNEIVGYPAEYMPYCRVIRSTPDGDRACQACDRNACSVASRTGKPYIYRCHAGFVDTATPLNAGGVRVGYLLFGHIFPYTDRDAGIETIISRCEKYGCDTEALRIELIGVEKRDESYIKSAAHILHAVASYLILENMATPKHDRLAAGLDRIISEGYTEKITVERLCRELGVCRTELYNLSKSVYGTGPAERIRSLRISRAKELLSGTRMKVSEIARLCGYDDYNYFISVFTRETGNSPNRWRTLYGTNGMV